MRKGRVTTVLVGTLLLTRAAGAERSFVLLCNIVENADGTGAAHLTENQAFYYSPAWSPDGNKIIFMRQRSGNDDLWAMNPDGSNQSNLTNEPAADDEPDWQPT